MDLSASNHNSSRGVRFYLAFLCGFRHLCGPSAVPIPQAVPLLRAPARFASTGLGLAAFEDGAIHPNRGHFCGPGRVLREVHIRGGSAAAHSVLRVHRCWRGVRR